jgi:transcriptional regulator with XRE-family HTH domain
MEFTALIKQGRQKNYLSLRDAAKKLGISFTYLSKLEHGKEQPSQRLCLEIAFLYRLPEKDLLFAAKKVPIEMFDWIFASRENFDAVMRMVQP